MKKYQIIYADPPWQFSSKQLQKYNGKRFASLDSREYSTMTIKDICDLSVIDIADNDSVLFLWVTDAHIPEAIEVIKSWGFRYTTVAFVWSKKTKKWKQVATLGAWTMKNCELCFLATRGQMLKYKQANNVYQLLEAIRRDHSRKPDEIRDRIVKIFGDLLRIELFAREKTPGWDVWGNEVKSDIEL